MNFYPDYFSSELNLEAIPNPPDDRTTYNQYVISLGKLWCKKHDMLYSTLVASLLSSVLQGNILIETKDAKAIHRHAWNNRVDRAITPIKPSDVLYNVYTKHKTPLSDYSELEFMVGYKSYLLDKLGRV